MSVMSWFLSALLISACVGALWVSIFELTVDGRHERQVKREREVVWALINASQGVEHERATEFQDWMKVRASQKRRLLLIAAGITPKDVKRKEVRRLDDEELRVMAALNSAR